MPNASGSHSARNAKTISIPSNVTKEKIIGYTGELEKTPTVYFTLGHFTQDHPDKWNIGWDGYESWQCKFFGNVPKGSDDHSANLHPDEYVRKLERIGYNRFVGGRWDLSIRPKELQGHRLREFWVRGAGVQSKDRFAHPSRNCFTPVSNMDGEIREKLWGQVCARLPTRAQGRGKLRA